MADFSIDQNNLPGVKEVCRDFAVLEDHCLAHNLQEQEIESHLASNVHKSRLVQQDLQVAKRLQEEEDLRAKAESQRKQRRMERIDIEVAQEIQEQLVRQAEQLRQQEEKDEAIARKLQEREMKEERKRQKQMESNFEEEYYEDKASRSLPHLPPDLQESNPHSTSPGYKKEKNHIYNQILSPYNSPKPDRKKHPHAHSHYPEYEPVELSRSRHPEISSKERILEHYSPERRTKYPEDYSKERNRPLDLDCTEPRRRKKQDQWDDLEPVVRRKEKPPKDYSSGQDRVWDKRNRDRERDGQRSKDRPRDGNRTRSQDRLFSGDVKQDDRGRNMDREMDRNGYRHGSRDRKRERGRDGNRGRHKSRDRSIEQGLDGLAPTRGLSEDSLEWEDLKSRPRLPSGPNEVFEEPTLRGPSNEGRSPGHSSRERGRKVRGEYGMKEATHGLAHLDLQDLELRDMEVARRLQEEEIKASQIDKRAAQVAQDEELARRLLEEEKREYKKSKEKEKQVIERRRPEVEYKPVQEEVVRPRMREEVRSREDEYQRARNHKPVRPPPPTQHYENINPSYAYVESPYTPRPPSRPEAAYKGAYYRQ